jgi:Tol biopolymer transport system component
VPLDRAKEEGSGARDGRRDVYIAPAAGGAPVAVTSDEHFDFSPAWSPDGAWLYFASTRGGSMAIWRVPVDQGAGTVTGDLQQVTSGGAADEGRLSLSADGRRLVYQQLVPQTTVELANFDLDSLTVGRERTLVIAAGHRISQFDVSPNGEWIVYRTVGARTDIYVIRADGSDERQLTDDAAVDFYPRWSPDSTRLAFYSNLECAPMCDSTSRSPGACRASTRSGGCLRVLSDGLERQQWPDRRILRGHLRSINRLVRTLSAPWGPHTVAAGWAQSCGAGSR